MIIFSTQNISKSTASIRKVVISTLLYYLKLDKKQV